MSNTIKQTQKQNILRLVISVHYSLYYFCVHVFDFDANQTNYITA